MHIHINMNIHTHVYTCTHTHTQEHIPQCLLDVLHRSELPELEVVSYAKQAAAAMIYLHQHNILHCDLAARNISFLEEEKK